MEEMFFSCRRWCPRQQDHPGPHKALSGAVFKSLCVVFMITIGSGLIAGDMNAVKDRLKNDPYMVPFYTGRILPEPQKVTYGNEFYPLDRTGILAGQGVEPDDPRLKILLDRITRYGGNCKFVDSLKDNDCITVFAVGDIAPAKDLEIPENAQGYAVKCFDRDGKHIVAFNARDRVGLTWAINSLVQMITFRDDETVIQSLDVCDFPFMLRRGSSVSRPPRHVDLSMVFPVMTKLDWIRFDASGSVSDDGKRIDWRKACVPVPVDEISAIGSNLYGLGVEWETSVLPFRAEKADGMDLQLRCGSDEDFGVLWRVYESALKAGGGICYSMGELRFPLHRDDKELFDSIAQADIHFITRLYKKMKGAYPDAGMSIVEPFSYGPRTFYYVPGIRLPWPCESPVEYLRMLGKELPRDIGMCWTGTQVETSGFTKKDVGRMIKLIGRHPCFLQNGSDCHHMHGNIYPSDRMTWWLNNGRNANVYREFDGAMINSRGLYSDMLWSAMLWNPAGFNAENAAYQATCKLLGPENYDVVRNLAEELAGFDRYCRYPGVLFETDLLVDHKAARDIKKIATSVSRVTELCDTYENNDTHPVAATTWAPLSGVLDILNGFHEEILTNSRLALYRAASAQEELAGQEVGLAKQDVFVAACDFGGGNLEYVCSSLSGDKRPAMSLSGLKPIATAQFTIPGNSKNSEYELLLCGKAAGDEIGLETAGGMKPVLVIYLNGTEIYKGKPPFDSGEWSVKSFSTHDVELKHGENSFLSVRVLDGNEEKDPNVRYSEEPVFSMSYAIIKNDQGKSSD